MHRVARLREREGLRSRRPGVRGGKHAVVAPNDLQRQFAHPSLRVEPHAQGPDVLELEGRFLPDDLALVQRLVMSGSSSGSHDGLPSS